MIIPDSTDRNPDRSTGPGVSLRVYALSDVGRTRDHNEDMFLIADLQDARPITFDNGREVERHPGKHGMVFLVADGMGGAASGELASSMAGVAVLEVLGAKAASRTALSPQEFAAALHDATTEANQRIHRHASENSEHRGMGTTATVVGLLEDQLYIAQVGDSRAYLIRSGVAVQLTKDQSLMQRLVDAGEMTQEEAEVSERRNIILQALGPEAQVAVDLTRQQLRTGDLLLLCSDGLSGQIRAEEIARLASENSSVVDLCHRLVFRANELGGPDNITVVAVKLSGQGLMVPQDDDYVGHREFQFVSAQQHDSYEQSVVSDASAPQQAGESAGPDTSVGGGESHTASAGNGATGAGAGNTNADHREGGSGGGSTMGDTGADSAHSEEDLRSRKDAAAPFVFLLALAALAAAAWAIWRLLQRD